MSFVYMQLYDFARNHRGLYQNSIPVAGKFYSSSGFEVLSWQIVIGTYLNVLIHKR
jgi:hypothetical protein